MTARARSFAPLPTSAPRSSAPPWLLASCLLAACTDADQGFSNAEDQGAGPVGTATMDVNPEELVFTDLIYEGETGAISSSLVFEVMSVGDGNLSVSAASLSADGGGAFYMEEVEDLTIAPGTAHEITVVATLHTYAEATGEVRIQSNDKEQLDFRFPLRATPLGWTGGADSGGADSGS